MPPAHLDEILILKEKIAELESWRLTVETDLREIRDIISQVILHLYFGRSSCLLHFLPPEQSFSSPNAALWHLGDRGAARSLPARVYPSGDVPDRAVGVALGEVCPPAPRMGVRVSVRQGR